MNIVTYLINLDDSKDRLDYASQQLQNAGIAFTRISAFDGRHLDLKTIKEYNEKKALAYMGLPHSIKLTDVAIDKVFIGSCTNSRIEDLRAAAAVAKGRKVANGVQALVVPGSGLVREQAEKEGLDKIFIEAGFEWRQPGCSMCLAMNNDRLEPGERCASTSNRNFEGRQGPGARTLLASPLVAAAAAVTGVITDPREFI